MFTGPLLYFVYDRLVPSLRTKRTTKAYLHPTTPTTLRIDIPIPKTHLTSSRYAPGDWSNLNFPQISKWNWHPFSIASYHPDSPDTFTFFVKVRGQWTKRLHELASTQHGVAVPVRIDGPFGARSNTYLGFRRVVCVGAGTGMAALVPFVRHYKVRGPEGGRVDVVWVARGLEDVLVYREFLEEVVGGGRGGGRCEVGVRVFLTRGSVADGLARRVGAVSSFLTAEGVEKKPIEVEKRVIDAAFSEVEKIPDCVVMGEKEKVGGLNVVVVGNEDGSVLSEGSQVGNEGLKYYWRLFGLNILLVFACFGVGVGGFAFARIQAFDFKTSTCFSENSNKLSGRLHFICWYWYYFGPVVMAVLFALLSGLLILLISNHLTSSLPPPPPTPLPDFDDVEALVGGLAVKEGRPNLRELLGGVLGEVDKEGDVAFMAAGPERMVLEVQECAAGGRGGRRAHFFRESFKV
ncbi:NADPH oxidase 4 [Dinochytrium kinnereticum]|nr:NADPH oxidase 4 [Dinochytrium kinnereticum]